MFDMHTILSFENKQNTERQARKKIKRIDPASFSNLVQILGYAPIACALMG
jgi:hypothetical protein